MLGNDVVDLAPRGAPHPRFDARVFSERERALIAGDGTQRMRWVLWAAKEAAYKAAKQADPAVVWAPSRFEVSLDSRAGARVRHGGRELALRIEQNAEFVHALAYGAELASEPHCGVERLAGGELSAAARAFACRALALPLGVAAERLQIAKRGRIPVLCVDGAPVPAELSLSHHGRFVAFACALPARAAGARLAS